jgi:lysophospholipase L1-like esterase
MRKIPTLLTAATLLCGGLLQAGQASIINNGDSIAFLGDSITYLGYRHKPNGYIHLVIEGLKQAGVEATAIPAGIGGNTSKHMLARLDKDVIAKKPVWMTLNCGVNDSPRLSVEEFAANIATIVAKAKAAGIKVILMNTTIGAGENLTAKSSLKRLTFCEEFKKLADKENLLLVDLNSAMTREIKQRREDAQKGKALTFDGTHLNGLGNQIVAEEILRKLGVSEADLATLRKRWSDYPEAVGMPKVSLKTYLALQAGAAKNGRSVRAHAGDILTNSVK